MKRVVYYDNTGPHPQLGFRGNAEAWSVRPDRNRPLDERLGLFSIDEPLYQALIHLHLVERLACLPHVGMLGPHEEVELLPEGLETAAELLREAANTLPHGQLEWVCGHQVAPEPVEYRLIVEADAVRKHLRDLAVFLNDASLRGYAVQFWL